MGMMFVMSCPFGGGEGGGPIDSLHTKWGGAGGGAVCSDFLIDPIDFDLSNSKLELQLTSFGDRFRDITYIYVYCIYAVCCTEL